MRILHALQEKLMSVTELTRDYNADTVEPKDEDAVYHETMCQGNHEV